MCVCVHVEVDDSGQWLHHKACHMTSSVGSQVKLQLVNQQSERTLVNGSEEGNEEEANEPSRSDLHATKTCTLSGGSVRCFSLGGCKD